MNNANSSELLGAAIVKALDLPGNVTGLTIRLQAGAPPVVEATLAPVGGALAEVPHELQRFKLVPIEQDE